MKDKDYQQQAEDINEPEQELNAEDSTEEVEEKEQGSAEIEELQKSLEEQKDKYVRLFAEFENYKRRTSREILEIRQTASKDLISSLLDVLDDIDRAEKTNDESADEDKLPEGVILIFNKFRKILESKGLKAIETMYTDFDVEKDEAISEMPVDDKKLVGKVVAEVQKGYMLNDKLIRFAKVVVGK